MQISQTEVQIAELRCLKSKCNRLHIQSKMINLQEVFSSNSCEKNYETVTCLDLDQIRIIKEMLFEIITLANAINN